MPRSKSGVHGIPDLETAQTKRQTRSVLQPVGGGAGEAEGVSAEPVAQPATLFTDTHRSPVPIGLIAQVPTHRTRRTADGKRMVS